MSALRNRKNVGTSESEGKKGGLFQVPQALSYMKTSVTNLIYKTPAQKKANVKRIEKASLTIYIFLFFIVFSFSFYLVRYLDDLAELTIASHQDEFSNLNIPVPCSNDYDRSFQKCAPKKCGRSIRDGFLSHDKLVGLQRIAKKGFTFGGGSGGASILDLHSGALSYKDKFINLYKVDGTVFNASDFALYTEAKDAVKKAIAKEYQIDLKHLHLTSPTFFSKLDSKPAVTKHDEYWHPHIDKVTYGTFYYTSLLYLSNYSEDFTGGRFIFTDNGQNKTIEPRLGRLSFFTSGSENQHFVERVASGTRYAITISFTCDKKHAIKEPGPPKEE